MNSPNTNETTAINETTDLNETAEISEATVLKETTDKKGNKILNLIMDERIFIKRWAMAFPASLAVVVTFIIFGVFDIYFSNHSLVPFVVSDILNPVLSISLKVFGGIFIAFMLLRGKFYDIALSLVIGLLTAGYLQGTFLNLKLGSLTGDMIPWHTYAQHSVSNLILWIAILLSPLVIYYFSRLVWKNIVVFLPIVLIGMQLSSLAAPVLNGGIKQRDPEAPTYTVSTKGLYELSNKDNIVVLVIDRLDTKYVDEVLEKNPTIFDNLDGFTYYPNTTSMYPRTYFSVIYMLTKVLWYNERPRSEAFKENFPKGKFIPYLRQNNYTTKLYISEYWSYDNPTDLLGQADNLDYAKTRLDIPGIVDLLMKMSYYRYVPHALKASFWTPEYDFSKYVIHEDGAPYWESDNLNFYDGLVKTRLSLTEDKNNFSFIHIDGSHAPYYMDENLRRLMPGEKGTVRQQTEGSFKIVYEFLNQMKALGIYDSSTIIITGDHGWTPDDVPLDTYKTTSFFLKPKGVSGTPYKVSDAPFSHEFLHPTILKSSGLDYSQFGTPLDELSPDVVRKFLYWVETPDKPNPNGYYEEFEIRGDARILSNWHKLREIPIKHGYND